MTDWKPNVKGGLSEYTYLLNGFLMDMNENFTHLEWLLLYLRVGNTDDGVSESAPTRFLGVESEV
jgi:hypothetical protein